VDDAEVGQPEGDEVPADIARQIVRSLDRSPSTVTALVGADLTTRWLSRSAEWLTDTDPSSRSGRGAFERVHPYDIDRLLEAFTHLTAANEASPGTPVFDPIRYRIRTGTDDDWVTREALVVNMLHDPAVAGLLLIVRPVGGMFDGIGHVMDLLLTRAPMPAVLGACAGLVPEYLGAAAVVGVLDDEVVVGVAPGGGVSDLAKDDRWWRDCLAEGEPHEHNDFERLPDDLADAGRAAGFRSVWELPLLDEPTGDVIGAAVVWVRIAVRLNISTELGLQQARRLAGLVISEQRRRFVLRRAALTDPLTGVANRSALRRRLDAATGPVTVVLVDLDDFKAVNDNYGHDAGDLVLTTVAERLTAAVREDDLVVRLGGDEFAVVVADDADAAPPAPEAPNAPDALAHRTQAAVEGPIRLGPTLVIPVHASVGVATAPARDVVRSADTALYEAKRAKQA